MARSLQDQVNDPNFRRPRVRIDYKVETEGAEPVLELPFVVGVMADLSAMSSIEKKNFKDRKFVPINRDNFGEVMRKTAPRVAAGSTRCPSATTAGTTTKAKRSAGKTACKPSTASSATPSRTDRGSTSTAVVGWVSGATHRNPDYDNWITHPKSSIRGLRSNSEKIR